MRIMKSENLLVRLLERERGRGGRGRIFFKENRLINESACRCTIVENDDRFKFNIIRIL